MKNIFLPAVAASALALSACGGDGDDALGDRAEDQAEAVADNLEANGMEAQADAVEDRGEATEERIDESDVDADSLNSAQQNALVNGQ